MSFLGLGGGDTSGLTPDQQQLQQQQGWYPRPDMVLPTGTPNTQPQGYSNLTPAQAQTVGQLGYYTNADATKPNSMFSDILSKLGSPQGQDALKKLQGVFPQQQQPMAAPPGPPLHYPGAYSPYQNVWNTRVSLDPQAALKRLQQGYPS